MTVIDIIGAVFMVVGALFYFLGGLGILRMPDPFDRIQAGTKATTLGAFSLLVGVGITHPEWIFKVVLIILFISLSNPIGSSALAKATYMAHGAPDNVVKNDLNELIGGEEHVS